MKCPCCIRLAYCCHHWHATIQWLQYTTVWQQLSRQHHFFLPSIQYSVDIFFIEIFLVESGIFRRREKFVYIYIGNWVFWEMLSIVVCKLVNVKRIVGVKCELLNFLNKLVRRGDELRWHDCKTFFNHTTFLCWLYILFSAKLH